MLLWCLVVPCSFLFCLGLPVFNCPVVTLFSGIFLAPFFSFLVACLASKSLASLTIAGMSATAAAAILLLNASFCFLER